MQTSLVKNILDYISYLESLSLEICLIDIQYYFLKSVPELLLYNGHRNEYCTAVKSSAAAHKKCIEKQFTVQDHCIDGWFCGMCWAGMYEFVFPVFSEKTPLCFICITGYAKPSQRILAHITKIAKHYNEDTQTLLDCYNRLKQNIPSDSYIETLIQPLCHMFELLYLQIKKNDSCLCVSSIYKEIIDFISENYTLDISLADIASACNYSTGYIRHVFKKESNYTISHYITNLRIGYAKRLLSSSNKSISEISSIVGYSEPNYFTNIFRKETGMSPKTYRKQFIFMNKN